MSVLNIFLLLLGLGMVVLGADALIEGASRIARRFGVSEFVIGVILVGFGTSLPELVVSVTGAIERNSDIAIGNVVGSNIFNVLIILAVTALFSPIEISRDNRRRDIPVTILLSMLVLLLGWALGGRLSRLDGAILLLAFAAYVFFNFKWNKHEAEEVSAKAETRPVWFSTLMTAGGLAALVFGGRLFVDKSVILAHDLGVSDKFIAITVLAVGTSLPEFVTSLVAAIKKHAQMALGNILGSITFNMLLILGTSAVITPMSFSGMHWIDLSTLSLCLILLWTCVFTGKKNELDRFDAILMLLFAAAYFVWLFHKL